MPQFVVDFLIPASEMFCDSPSRDVLKFCFDSSCLIGLAELQNILSSEDLGSRHSRLLLSEETAYLRPAHVTLLH